MYAGFIEGANDVILSNESSANESNIGGESVNHQYSKSFEFERDFDEFRRRNFPQSAVYFSLLRPFCELQIAKQFRSISSIIRYSAAATEGARKHLVLRMSEVPVCCDNALAVFAAR